MTAVGEEGSAKFRSSKERALFTTSAPSHPMRRSTRIRWQISVLLTSLDPSIALVERCDSLVVNLHGCALRAATSLPLGNPVQLQVNGTLVTGHVVDVVAIPGQNNAWMLGVALDRPGNFWGIQDPPKDWESFDETQSAQMLSELGQADKKGTPATEKWTLWPSAFGPAPQGCSATLAQDRRESLTQQVCTSDVAVDAVQAKLRPEVEGRAQAEARRLRELAAQQVQEAAREFRAELQEQLGAWRKERADIANEVQQLFTLREQFESRWKALAEAIRGEVVPLIGEVQRETQAIIRDFQDKITADSSARDKQITSTAIELERMQQHCTGLLADLQRRLDEDQAARVASSAPATTMLEAAAEQQRLEEQRRAEQEAALRAVREEVDRARRARESLESVIDSVPETVAAEMERRTQRTIAELRDSVVQDLETNIRSAVEKVEGQLFIGETGNQLSENHREKFERQLQDLFAVRLKEFHELHTTIRSSASESARIAAESQHVVVRAREQLQKMVEEQQERLGQANREALAALETVAGNMLTSMRHTLLSDIEREQKQVQNFAQTTIDELRNIERGADNALQERSRRELDSLRQELRNTFAERQRVFDTAHAQAAAQLQQLEKRTDELTALVDLELQSHTEESVREAVAEITRQLQEAAVHTSETRLADFRAELDRTVGSLVPRADEAGAELRFTLNSLQEQRKEADTASAQLQEKLHAANQWLAEETERYQQTLNAAFLKSAGEIRGRILQAVEMAGEPIECRGREIREEIAMLGRQQLEQSHSERETARQGLQSLCKESLSAADNHLQGHVRQALEKINQGAQELEEQMVRRLQFAVAETLAAIPAVFAAKLSTEADRPPTENAAVKNEPGEGDGGAKTE